jgi:mRNA interferase MazF
MNSFDRPYCPDTGDIIRVSFDPQAGREQAGTRPALVLTSRRYNQPTRLCVLCPITNQAKGYPFEVAIPAGLKVTGVVMADQVKSTSWEQRNSVFICASPPDVVREVKARIGTLLRIV